MDPARLVNLIPPSGAIQAALLKAGLPAQELAVFLSMVGQELDLVLLSTAPTGSALRLPSGRVLTATGELPFPEGTQLRVRVLSAPSGDGVRLQTLEARPPAPPPILAALNQGEAAPLLARLLAQEPAPGLEGLVRLLQVLSAAEPAAGLPPGPAEVSAALERLPAPLFQALARSVGLEADAPPSGVAKVLTAWLARAWEGGEAPMAGPGRLPQSPAGQPLRASPPAPSAGAEAPNPAAGTVGREVPRAVPSAPPASGLPSSAPLARATAMPLQPRSLVPATSETPPAPAGAPKPLSGGEGEAAPASPERGPEPTAILSRGPEAVLTGFQHLLARVPDLPPVQQDALTAWLRQLLGGTPESGTTPEGRPASVSGRTPAPESAPASPPLEPRAAAAVPLARTAGRLQQALVADPGPPGRLPETWEAWIRGGTQTLADPVLSPREAPFHALQALDATSFFELPVPWAPFTPLHLWVEADAPERSLDQGPRTTRLLLGTHFSHLGETRVGLEQGPSGLRVRIWVQHPEQLEDATEGLEAELRDLGGAVDLRILPLGEGPVPSLRSVVAGSSLHALG